MFYKRADCNILEIKSSNEDLFQDILAANATEFSKISTLPEDSIQARNYAIYKRIAEKKHNILAFATRAISANETWGPNKNGDAFERSELTASYKTFIMQPHLLDHKMEIPFVRGIIAHAAWRPLIAPKTGDFVETLIFVDRDDFPKYASEVEKGIVNSFSMGVEVREAECSHCKNLASSPTQLCYHAKHLKNLFVEGKKVFEWNRGLNFIEQSAVVSPADPDSHRLYVLAHVKNSMHQDVERLRKLAEVLDSFSEDEKKARFQDYYMIELAANSMADKILADLNIRLGR